MATRNGKIAHLPNDIREQLNLRLLEGETGAELAAWLNALPEVQSVLNSQFNGAPISEVNLTHWRQGGYLQWLTERECFDSARALADGDFDLAKAGLSAERLLNVLALRYGELLMRWDFSHEGVPDSAAISEVTRKARILQGISRSVLAIHRIQSQAAAKKAVLARPASSANTRSEEHANANPLTAQEILKAQLKAQPTGTVVTTESKSAIRNCPHGTTDFSQSLESQSEIPNVLSGRVSPSSVPLDLSQTPFKFDADLAEFLTAV